MPPRTAAPRRVKGILLPGLDGSGGLFAPFLAARPRALDAEPLSYPARAALGYDELAALVRPRLPRGRFVLLAESFSGPLAVRLAAERPRGLAALVLAATFLHRPLDPLLHPVRGLAGARFFGLPMPAALVRHFMAGADAPDALVREVQRAMAAVPAAVLAHRSAEAVRVDAREALASVEVPILFLAPTRDRLIRTDAHEDLLAVRPDAEVAPVDGPHMILQRCPHACLARIEEFLTRGRAPGPARPPEASAERPAPSRSRMRAPQGQQTPGPERSPATKERSRSGQPITRRGGSAGPSSRA